MLHRLGDLALLRCLQEWIQAGGELDELVEKLIAFEAMEGARYSVFVHVPEELEAVISA